MVSSDIFVRDTDGHTRPGTLPAWLEQLTGGQSHCNRCQPHPHREHCAGAADTFNHR